MYRHRSASSSCQLAVSGKRYGQDGVWQPDRYSRAPHERRAAAGRRKSKRNGTAPRQADDPDEPSRRRPISRLINRAIFRRLRLSRENLLFTVIFTFLVVTVLGFAAGPTALAGSLFLSLCGLSWRGLALFQSASLFVLVSLQVFAQWGHYFP